MQTNKLALGIIGCGNIAGQYARDLTTYPELELVGVADMDTPRAEALASSSGARAYPSPQALMEDPAIDVVVNLTTHLAHKEVVTQALNAGKHVYSEKPLALSYEDAKGLVELAEQRNLRLGCSPCTWMGEAQQTAWKLLREGRIGKVRVVYGEMNWGRIESWHPAPAAFYDVGPLWDIGVYPLTFVTTVLGPARRVMATGKVLYPDRVTKEGVPFHVTTPDFVTGTVELEDGTLVRITVDFYVSQKGKQNGVELHGDLGSVYLGSPQHYNTVVEHAEFNQPYQPVPYVREPYNGTEWGCGVRDMANAIREDRPHRATGAQAAHVVEILEAMARSMQEGRPMDVHSSFAPPTPMEWGV
ncbi:MAG: Gfo/Idh/MocA family oxidoreductase [Chloroflexota bacterium]|nr:Gfo/Idh/MocA family oxidoreductase [Chloroflexota bacterium]